jgi:hypothetical protein
MAETISSSTRGVADIGKIIDPEPKDRLQLGTNQSDDASKSSPQSRDFFWDQVSVYAISGMLLIAALDIITSFTSDAVRCHGPDNFTRDQSAFMNSYCTEKTPRVDYFLFYIVGQAIVIAGPHFVWKSWFSGKLTQFTALSLSLDLHRESQTGDYAQDNIVKVESLKATFGDSFSIHGLYLVKVVLQLICCIGAFVCSTAPFYEADRMCIFNPVFGCKYTGPYTDFLELENYIFNVTCVVPVLRSHYAVWITNYVLLVGIVICLCFALVWWIIPHQLLNWKEAAMFSLQSGIPPHHYDRWRAFSLRMQTDLDFLLLRLFGQDEGHGKVLREILIMSLLKTHLHEAKEHLNLIKLNKVTEHKSGYPPQSPLLPCVPSKAQTLEDILESQDDARNSQDLAGYLLCIIKSLDYGFGDDESITAVDLTFGTDGYSTALAQLCEWVVSINLDHHYLNTEQSTVHRTFNSGVHSIRTKSDIYAQPDSVSQQFSTEFVLRCLNKNIEEPHRGQAENTIKLFVIGPFSDPDRMMTIHWFLYSLKEGGYVDSNAKLIVVAPLQIGDSDVRKKFQIFKPILPWKYAGLTEHSLMCGMVACKFMISVYKVDQYRLPAQEEDRVTHI